MAEGGPLERQDIITDDALKAPGILTDEFVKLLATLDDVVKKSQEYGNAFTTGEASTTKMKEATASLSDEQKVLGQVTQQINTLIAKQSDEYAELANIQNEQKQILKDKIKLGDEDAQSITRQNSSIFKLSAALDSNRVAFSKLTTEADRNTTAGKKLLATIVSQDKALKDLRAEMGQNQAKVGDYKGELEGLFSKLGEGGSRIGEVFNLLGETATGAFGIIGAALVVASFGIKQYFERTAEGEEELERITSELGTLWDREMVGIARITSITFGSLLKYFTDYIAITDAAVLASRVFADEQHELNEQVIANIGARAQAEVDAAKLIQKAREDVDEPAQKRLDQAVEGLTILKKQHADDLGLQLKQANLEKERIVLSQHGNELTQEQRKTIQNLYADILKSDAAFISSQRRLETFINSLRKQIADEAEAEHKAALQKQKDLDAELAKRQQIAIKIQNDQLRADGQRDKSLTAVGGKSAAADDEQSRINQIRAGIVPAGAGLITGKEMYEESKKLLQQAADDKIRIEKELKEQEVKLAQTAASSIIDVVNKQFAYQEERIAVYMGRLRESYQEDISIAGDNKEAKIQLTNEYTANEKKAQHELSVLRRKQAEFDKATAISEIVIRTAQAIVTDLENPPKMVLDAAIGATQLAKVVATPLPPLYAEGTDNHPGGMAIVGEQGSEFVIQPHRGLTLVSRATLMDLSKGSEVVPNDETLKILAMSGLRQPDIKESPNLNRMLLSELKMLRQETKSNRPTTINLARNGGVLYEVHKIGETFYKKLRAKSMGA